MIDLPDVTLICVSSVNFEQTLYMLSVKVCEGINFNLSQTCIRPGSS